MGVYFVVLETNAFYIGAIIPTTWEVQAFGWPGEGPEWR